MRVYDRLWIMASLMSIWDLINYGQSGSDFRFILAYVFQFIAFSFFFYVMHLDNMGRK